MKDYHGEYEELDSASQWIYKASKIPNFQDRIDNYDAVYAWPEFYQRIRSLIDGWKSLILTLRTDTRWWQFLKILLDVSNVITEGTDFGNSYGFRLSHVRKFNYLRSNDKSYSLIEYVIKQIYEVDASLMDFALIFTDKIHYVKSMMSMELKGKPFLYTTNYRCSRIS